MADTNPFDPGQFMPGFKFLQGLASGTGSGPTWGRWVAPTVDIPEIERRISELKAVLFWLEQNQMGVKATIQALEVQKMTLSTLRSMNFDMAEMAKAFRMPTAGSEAGQPKPSAPRAASGPAAAEKPGAKAVEGAAAPVQDPMQWWSALTEQFQQIATQTLAEATRAAQAQSTQGAAGKAAAPPAPRTKAAASKGRATKSPASGKSRKKA